MTGLAVFWIAVIAVPLLWALLLLSALLHSLYAAHVVRTFPPAPPLSPGGPRGTRRGSGPVVAFVHGMNGMHADFPDALLDDLARDHTVLAIDRPGHAASPRGPALDLGANARAVLSALPAGAHAVLVGHSYGAPVVLRAALDDPDRVAAVVLLTPCLAVDDRNVRYVRFPLAGIARRAALEVFTLPGGWFVTPRTRREAWSPAPAPPGRTASRAWALVPAQLDAALENFRTFRADLARLLADLPRLRAPLAVLVGADDGITPWRTHAAWLPGIVPTTKLHVLEGVGHWLPRTNTAEVAALVRELSPRA